MRYAEFGKKQNETILFLHGGGLAPWNFAGEARLLEEEYRVVIPVLDGHNGSDRDFTSIEDNADEIIAWIDENCGGKVLMLGGLSLGGQILAEILAKRKDICRYAILESALVLPMKVTYACIRPTFSLCWPLIRKRWFARAQFRSLHIREDLFEDYYRDSAAISKENLIAFLKANSDYRLKESLRETRAKVLVLAGGRESGIMKRSAGILKERIPGSVSELLPGLYHGEFSLNHAPEYVQRVRAFLSA